MKKRMSAFAGYKEAISMRLYGRGLKRDFGYNQFTTFNMDQQSNLDSQRHQQKVSGRFYFNGELSGETTDEHQHFEHIGNFSKK